MSPGPPPPVRFAGKAITRLVAKAPASWPLLRRPTQRFFDRIATRWDERTADPNRLAPLEAAVASIEAPPARILDLGTGTGAAAGWLAERFPRAAVIGVDLSEEMIRVATEQAADALSGRLRFEVADASALPYEDAAFNLVVQVSVPAFFSEASRVLAPNGHLIVVSSLGPATPFHTPVGLLRRGFEGEGLEWVGEGAAGPGTYYRFLKGPGLPAGQTP